jgi:hypothetical protein
MKNAQPLFARVPPRIRFATRSDLVVTGPTCTHRMIPRARSFDRRSLFWRENCEAARLSCGRFHRGRLAICYRLGLHDA